MCKDMNIWCVHEVHMSPTLNGSSALLCVKLGDALEICEGIIFDFYLGLPHLPSCLHSRMENEATTEYLYFSSNTSVKGFPRRKVDIVSSCIFETARHHMRSTWLTYRKSIRKFLTSYVVPCVASMLWYFSGHFEHEDIDFHTWIITLKTASF